LDFFWQTEASSLPERGCEITALRPVTLGMATAKRTMTTDASKITAAQRGVTFPSLCVQDGVGALEHYEQAFGAQVEKRQPVSATDQRLMHSAVRIYGATFFVHDDFPEWGDSMSHVPTAQNSVTFYFSVDDVDASFQRAVGAGCTAKMPPQDQFWGDRHALVTCKYGHNWAFVTPLAGGADAWPKADPEEWHKGGEPLEKKSKE
jgi:PhnB protein